MSQTPSWMTQAKADYEADVKRRPTYHDGTPRRKWEDLSKEVQGTWNPNRN